MSFINFGSNEEPEGKDDREVVRDIPTNFPRGNPNFITANCLPEFEDQTIIQGIGNYANWSCNQHAPPSSVPLCRQFWKAGDYNAGLPLRPVSHNGQNRLRVHPKFLHSNATSHKWAFGAIAELLDNAIDEVQNGATFVVVDKITNPRDGNPALLIHDGNGFKTSTMRLGADVIVFSCCLGERSVTQSVGLLSYTFLRQTGYDDIIVPMVDYEVEPLTGVLRRLIHHGQRQFHSNLSTLLLWSPFATEAELLRQFNDMGHHGTKVIVFNLWFSDNGDMELDFDTDEKDIMISGGCGAPEVSKTKKSLKLLNHDHIANRFRYSLRVYSSFLYLHLPENFKIILRGQVVDPHHIVSDLRFVECVKYKPQVGGNIEPTIFTTIGFLEGAPNVAVHGFNIYHKNRLILPFWPVFEESAMKCKGVAGVLEVNFLKPTHNKQNFEKSNTFQKLETRLKDMALEYWYYHCHLIGYSSKKVASCAVHQMLHSENQPAMLPLRQLPGSEIPSDFDIKSFTGTFSAAFSVSQFPEGNGPHLPTPTYPSPGHITNFIANSQAELPTKRRHENHIDATGSSKKRPMDKDVAGDGHRSNKNNQPGHRGKGREIRRLVTMVRENKKLQTKCLEYEKKEKQLLIKVQMLKEELKNLQLLDENLQLELKVMNDTKEEK